MRFICSARAGARSISSKPWSRTCRCRWSIRCRHGCGKCRSGCTCGSRSRAMVTCSRPFHDRDTASRPDAPRRHCGRCRARQRRRADRRAVLQGPANQHDRRHRAGRHQRHHGAVRGATSRPVYSGQSDHRRAEPARRRGIASANRLYNVFERDGSVIVKLERAVPMLAIQGDPAVNFDPLKITWLGSLSSYARDAYLMLVMATNPVKSVDDLKGQGKSITLGGDNVASSNLIFANIAKDILGLNIKVVRGYVGAAPMFLAMQRGEIDGQIIGYSSVLTGQRDLWTHHAFRPLLQFGRSTRLADFPDVPTGNEMTKDPGALALLDFADLQFSISLPFAAPPGVPADRAKALETAFMAMCRDPAVLDDAEKLGIEMSPIDGETVLKSIARAAATPREVIERYNALVGPDKN